MTVQSNGDIVATMPEKTRIPPDELARALQPGESVTVTGRPVLRRGEAPMPWLKAAYLSVFSLLGPCGYHYADGAAIRQIRRQILEPSKEIVPAPILSGVGLHPQWPSGGIHMDRAGGHWMVKIGDRLVPLPTGSEESLYDRLAREWSLPQGGVAEINYTTSGGPLWYPLKFGEVDVFNCTVPSSDVTFASTGTVTATSSDGDASMRFVVADSREQVLTGLLTARLK